MDGGQVTDIFELGGIRARLERREMFLLLAPVCVLGRGDSSSKGEQGDGRGGGERTPCRSKSKVESSRPRDWNEPQHYIIPTPRASRVPNARQHLFFQMRLEPLLEVTRIPKNASYS